MYDKVVVMENGEIVEEGHHDELKEVYSGFFSQSKND